MCEAWMIFKQILLSGKFLLADSKAGENGINKGYDRVSWSSVLL